METRGRESKAEREVLQLVPEPAPLRPDPPATLSVEEAEEWRNVVANMAPGWFRKEYRGILVAYCQQVVVGGFFAAKAAEVADKEGEGLELYIKLTKAAERANRAADKFGTTLRITPQSRYDAHKAARDSNKTQATRPW